MVSVRRRKGDMAREVAIVREHQLEAPLADSRRNSAGCQTAEQADGIREKHA